MRRFVLPLLLLVLAGCASVDRPKPLTGADVVALSKAGKAAKEIIEELRRTDTVLPLQATDFIRLHDAGVADEVLDYLQFAMINDIRWRDRYSNAWYGYGPLYRGVGPCPWPPVGRPYRDWRWSC